jgi:hypothetical protein
MPNQMTLFKVHDQLETSLTDWCSEVAQKTGSPLVFGHICLGSLSEDGPDSGGGARLTRVVCRNSDLEIIHNPELEYLFRSHINRFGRSATVLDWLTRWFYGQAEKPSMLGEDGIAFFQFIKTAVHSGGPLAVDGESLQLDPRFVEALLPDAGTTAYLKEAEKLHSTSGYIAPDEMDFCMKQLIGARYTAQQQVAGASLEVANLLNVYDGLPQATQPFQLWTFLGAIQTAFLLMKAAGLDGAPGFVSVGRVHKISGEETTNCPLLVMSSVVPSTDSADLSKVLKEMLGETKKVINSKPWSDLFGAKNVANEAPTSDDSYPPSDRLKIRELSEAIKKARTSGQRAWFAKWETSLVTWLGLAIEHLRGSKHEGKSLPFTLIAGDWSAIADSGLFEVLRLDFDEASPCLFKFDVADPSTAGLDFFKTLEREISRKNYSWFADGKYALAWDVTWPAMHPRALIRIKDSSWEVALSSLRSGRVFEATRIARWIAFLSNDGAGGLLHNGQTVGIFRRDKSWVWQSPDFQKTLTTHVEEALGRAGFSVELKAKVLERLIPTLLTLSDDPHAGALLVILQPGNERAFESMGAPWKTAQSGDFLSMSPDELAALMAMDGATCLYCEGGKARVSFRSLVSVPAKPTRELTDDARKKLDGEGSRKWSSANAARRSEVALVLSVSQDGPIHVYGPKIVDTKEQVHVDILRAS